MKNKGYAKFWGANKVHLGRCASGVLVSTSMYFPVPDPDLEIRGGAVIQMLR